MEADRARMTEFDPEDDERCPYHTSCFTCPFPYCRSERDGPETDEEYKARLVRIDRLRSTPHIKQRRKPPVLLTLDRK